jgi:hypothetical protein
MLKYGLYIYIFLLPFVSAFAISGTLTLSVLWVVVLILIYVFGSIQRGYIEDPGKPENLLLAGFFLFVFLGYVVNSFLQVKPTNHLIAYFITVFAFFVLLNQLMDSMGRGWDIVWDIVAILFYSMMFASLFAVAEFGLKVFANINVNDFIPRPLRSDYEHSVLDKLLTRVRGFSEESGHHAMMMETFGPLCGYYALVKLRAPMIVRWLCALILLLSLLLTFSAGAFLFIPLATGIATLYFLAFRHIKLLYLVGGSLVLLVLNFVVVPLLGMSAFGLIYTIVEGKLSGGGSLTDRTDRFTAFTNFYEQADIFHRIVGYGPSGFRVAELENSILSLYPTILFEGGVFGFAFFLAFLVYIFYVITKIEHAVKIYLMIGFIACCGHYAIVGGYWRPWLWFLCALICFIARSEIFERTFEKDKLSG